MVRVGCLVVPIRLESYRNLVGFASNPSHWVLTRFDLDCYIQVYASNELQNPWKPRNLRSTGQQHGNGLFQPPPLADNIRTCWYIILETGIDLWCQVKYQRHSGKRKRKSQFWDTSEGTKPPKRGRFASELRHWEGSRRPLERLASSSRVYGLGLRVATNNKTVLTTQ